MMVRDTLVILCDTAPDGQIANEKLPSDTRLERLFVFLGERPSQDDLHWIHSGDHHLCLERAREWATNPAEVAMRAGLLYSIGWSVIFCEANALPSTAALTQARETLMTEGSHIGERVWGISREHAVIHGFSLDSTDQTHTHTVSDIDIAQAISGVPSSWEAILAALPDFVPQGGATILGQPTQTLHDLAMAVGGVEGGPNVVALGAETEEAINMVRDIGVAIVVLDRGEKLPVTPIRTFNLTTGEKVAILANTGTNASVAE